MSDATIHPGAKVGNAKLASGVSVREGAVIGDGCVLEENVTVCEGTVLGANVRVLPGAVLGRPPVPTAAASRPLRADLPPLVIGAGSVIGANAVLYRGSTLGAEVLIGDLVSVREECSIGDRSLIGRAVTINYHTVIGANVKIMDLTHLTGNMIIEDDVFVSAHVSSANDNRMWEGQYVENEIRGPVLRRGCSIGLGAVLLPTVEVGERAIVGAGSVVTKNVKPGSLVIGVPARLVRMNAN